MLLTFCSQSGLRFSLRTNSLSLFAKAMAVSTQGVKGYLPADMNIVALGRNFKDITEQFMNGGTK